ncbi:MAG: alkene reductase [Rhodospirillales bacterium]|jgi:N-ethylmaleimide reductase|nr:alkene reductase [Rhodospirillales bacterium]MDP6774984.1 alkene reductase [Rhodospirillales bacterium]
MPDPVPETEAQRQDAPLDLFTPIHVGPYTLANRAVMAPMTRNRSPKGNAPGDMNVEYYRQRAQAGLIITEGSQVSPQGCGYPGTPGIYNAEQVTAWRRVTDTIHAADGRIFLQLWHVGRISHPSLQPDGAPPVAPSAIRPEGDTVTVEGRQPFVTPRALETDELPGIVEQYRLGASNALEAGFDGVEIHGANGYLLDQFLRDGSNRRTDAYGGSPDNRARLLLEVTDAVAGVWGAARVGVRLSPVNSFNSMADSNPDETFPFVAGRLDDYDLAYLHVVEWDVADASNTYDKERMRRAFTGTYMVNSGYNLESANAALAAGAADLVSFGKPFIANPDLVERFAKGALLNEPDPSTFYGGDEKGYTDYPFLGG